MSIMQEFMEDGPEISLVQNRLTAAGLVLAALFFSANFSIGLYGQLRDVRVAEYRIEFAQIEAPLAIEQVFPCLQSAACSFASS